MAVAFNPDKLHRIILPEDRGAENPTVFFLKPLRQKDREAVLALFPKDEKNASPSDFVKIANYMLPRMLVGWENFRDEDGEEVPFQTKPDGKPNWDENRERLGFGLQTALFREAQTICFPPDDELGKSPLHGD